MRRCRQANRGFTLIELMTAAAVVAILAVFAMTAYFNAQRKGNRSAAEISNILARIRFSPHA